MPSPEVVGVVAVTRINLPRTGKAGLSSRPELQLGAVGAESFVLLGLQAEFLRNDLEWAKEYVSSKPVLVIDRSRGSTILRAAGTAHVMQATLGDALLHRFRALDAQPAQHRHQFAQHHGGRCEQEDLPRRIFFGEDVVLVVEVVEFLRQLECVFGQDRRAPR